MRSNQRTQALCLIRTVMLLAVVGTMASAACAAESRIGLKRFEVAERGIRMLKADYPLSKPVNRDSIRGKVLCGYQAWFFAKGDGNPYKRWQHCKTGTTRCAAARILGQA